MSEFIIGHPLRNVARKRPALAQLLWRIDFAFMWVLIALFRLLPIDIASRFGDRLGRWLGKLMKRKSGMFRDNFQKAFPELSATELDSLVNGAWGSAGRLLAEYRHLDTILREDERLQIEILEPIATYQDPAIPCVIVTAHVSNWEVVCSAMARLGIPNASLYSPPHNPYLDKMLLDSRLALNCQLYPRDNSARHLMRALKGGRTAAMVMDRRVEDNPTVSFFGHDKPSTQLPARLALKFSCDLVPVQVIRLHDARFKVIFHPPIRSSQPTADEDTQALEMTQQIHGQFETWIGEHPESWFCSKRVWPRPKRYLKEIAAAQAEDAAREKAKKKAQKKAQKNAKKNAKKNANVDTYAA
jgi:KDO2-lipid IV(A) lauroyltransferase